MLKSGSSPKPEPCMCLVNSVEILAVRLVKQGMEAERFRAVQSSVQPLHSTVVGGMYCVMVYEREETSSRLLLGFHCFGSDIW